MTGESDYAMPEPVPLREPAAPYVPRPNDHVWEDGQCVKCGCARLGTRAVLTCDGAPFKKKW